MRSREEMTREEYRLLLEVFEDVVEVELADMDEENEELRVILEKLRYLAGVIT